MGQEALAAREQRIQRASKSTSSLSSETKRGLGWSRGELGSGQKLCNLETSRVLPAFALGLQTRLGLGREGADRAKQFEEAAGLGTFGLAALARLSSEHVEEAFSTRQNRQHAQPPFAPTCASERPGGGGR